MVEIADWLRETCHVLARCWRDAGGTPTRCQWARVIGVAVAFRIHLSCSRVNIPSLLALHRELTTLLWSMGT